MGITGGVSGSLIWTVKLSGVTLYKHVAFAYIAFRALQ